MTDYFNLLFRLNKAGVDFVIIGGFAGVVHGCTLVTQDIDICCDFSPENLLLIQDGLSELNPVHRMTPKKPKLKLTMENCEQYNNLYLDTDLGQLDCLGAVDGIGDFAKVKSQSQPIEVDDLEFHVLGIDALIDTKKALNRPRDAEAIIQLEAIKKLQKEAQEEK